MGTRRLGLALTAALVISLVVTSVFYVRITRAQANTRPRFKRVVAAAATLQPGTPIPADKLTEINWPEGVTIPGLIEKKEDVAGRVLVNAVAANEPVLRRDLAAPSSLGLAARIPDGMRASAVKTNEVMGVAGFIFPGSRVDVLVTLRGDHPGVGTTMTRIVLQNVQVLSTGTKTDPDPTGKPENVSVVTLLVSPEQSEKLALAQSQGTIQFALRNGGDSVTADAPPVDMAALIGIQKPPVEPEVPRPKHVADVKAAAPVKPRDPYVVETVANGKVTIAKFQITPE
jgi:pilus assembly protein CpaB